MKKRHLLSVALLFSSMLGFAQNTLSMDAVKIAPGETAQVSVNLNNATPYTAFQFDMTLPDGITVEEATLNTERATTSHILKTGTVNGKFRVLAYSYNDETKEGNKPLTGSEGAIVNLTLKAGESIAEGATIVIDAGNQNQDGGQVFVEADGTPNYSMDEVAAAVTVNKTESVTITSAGQAILCSSKNLDFSDVADVKAYIVSGHDKSTGVIWLTRVFDVPAGETVLLMGNAGTYPIPVVEESRVIYENMLVGCKEATTITKDGGDNVTNYILSKPEGKEVGFYYAKETGSPIKAGGGYLPLPTTIEASGEAGSTVKIAMNKYGMKSYCPSQSLDFSEVEGLKAYIASGYTKKGIIRLTRIKQVPKGLGVLLMAPAETKEYDVKTASLQQCYANMFEGTLVDKMITQIEDNIVNYYLSVVNEEVGYYLASTQGTKISANGSWLPVPKSMTSFVNATRGGSDIPESLSLFQTDEMISLNLIQSVGGEDDGTTGIKRVDSEVDNDVWYNLKGQRIDTPTRKGLFIKNGKKVVVK